MGGPFATLLFRIGLVLKLLEGGGPWAAGKVKHGIFKATYEVTGQHGRSLGRLGVYGAGEVPWWHFVHYNQ